MLPTSIFMPGRMAAHAVGEIADVFFLVLGRGLTGGVFVAAIAGVRLQALWMAGLAGAGSTFAMIDGECVRPAISGWRPGRRGVTGGAIITK